MMYEDPFEHVSPPYAQGEVCYVCKEQATHKVGEECDQPRHNFTTYLCCEHFGYIMGKVAQRWCAGEWPPTARKRLEELRVRAAKRMAEFPSYPDSLEKLREDEETLRAMMPGQLRAMAEQDEDDGSV